jgi:hypothetical protein
MITEAHIALENDVKEVLLRFVVVQSIQLASDLVFGSRILTSFPLLMGSHILLTHLGIQA